LTTKKEPCATFTEVGQPRRRENREERKRKVLPKEERKKRGRYVHTETDGPTDRQTERERERERQREIRTNKTRGTTFGDFLLSRSEMCSFSLSDSFYSLCSFSLRHFFSSFMFIHTQTHAHTHISIYAYALPHVCTYLIFFILTFTYAQIHMCKGMSSFMLKGHENFCFAYGKIEVKICSASPQRQFLKIIQ
jgi:hypothetical protein